MPRVAVFLLASSCVLGPRVAWAQDDSPLGRIQSWFSQLGKPRPPPPPPPEEPGVQDTFTLNPLALPHQQLGVEYERAFGRGFSAYVSPEVGYGSAASTWQLSVGGTVGARIFVLGNAPAGLFFGPEVSAVYQRVSQAGVLRKALGLGLGGSVGATVVLFTRLAVSAGFAAEYRSVPDLQSSEEGSVRMELVPIPRLAFGVAF